MDKILHIIGARPNFMKAAPVISEIEKGKNFEQVIVHTGQHFDREMSGVFLSQLNIPKPKHKFSLQSKSALSQISEIITKLDPHSVYIPKEKDRKSVV